MLRRRELGGLGLAAWLGLRGGGARAAGGITIGAPLSITGPTAAQGVGYHNGFALLPTTIAGLPVNYVIRDDGGDPTACVSIMNKMIGEDHVDAFIGPTLTSTGLATIPVANGAKVVTLVMAPVTFDATKNPFTFNVAQPAVLMIDAVGQHMRQHGAKTVGFIGYGDGWGDEVFNGLKAASTKYGIAIVAEERYARTDTSVQAQVLRAMSKHPDVMMLGGSAVPGALPNIALAQRGFKGQIYNNHGVVSPEYIRVGGASVAGCIAPTGPLVVYDQLQDSNPVKPVGMKFMESYLAKFGPQSRNAFCGYTEDAFLILQNAVPAALAHGQPGTEAFRVALRGAIEATKGLVGTHGVYTMSPTDHHGVDSRACVLVQVTDGAWKLIPT